MATRNKLSKLFQFRQAAAADSGVPIDQLVKFADEMGYNLSIEKGTGRVVPVPKDISAEDLPSLSSSWESIYDRSFSNFENREKRVKMYDLMDRSGAEGSVVLDVFADEIVNVTDNSEKSLEIQISDPEFREKIMKVLVSNGVITNMRQDIRAMCKDGDFSYVLSASRGENLVRLSEEDAKSHSTVVNPVQPEDINLRFVKSTQYELAGYGNKVYKLKIERDAIGGFKYDLDEYMPWEFAPFIIADRDTFPYGKSVLEKMRVPFEQLMILEKLLAVARANSIDRVAVKVPGLGVDISSMMAKMSQIKNSIKTLLQVGNNSRMTRNQDQGLTEWFIVPKEFEVSKLSTAINLGTPDDVIYFRDKLYNASRLPKGFFVLSESSNTQRPMSLRQQDLKFARSLIPVSESYCNGLRHLIILIAFYLGADISKLQVKVSLKKSPYISGDLLQQFEDVLRLISSQQSTRVQFEPDYKPSKEDILAIMDMVGAPVALIFPEFKDSDKMRGNQNQYSQLYDQISGDKSDRVLFERSLERMTRISSTFTSGRNLYEAIVNSYRSFM